MFKSLFAAAASVFTGQTTRPNHENWYQNVATIHFPEDNASEEDKEKYQAFYESALRIYETMFDNQVAYNHSRNMEVDDYAGDKNSSEHVQFLEEIFNEQNKTPKLMQFYNEIKIVTQYIEKTEEKFLNWSGALYRELDKYEELYEDWNVEKPIQSEDLAKYCTELNEAIKKQKAAVASVSNYYYRVASELTDDLEPIVQVIKMKLMQC